MLSEIASGLKANGLGFASDLAISNVLYALKSYKDAFQSEHTEAFS